MTGTLAFIGIGSNLGDPPLNIARARGALHSTHGIVVNSVSGALENPALKTGDADPGGPYLNAVAAISTTLTPLDLLEALLRIERHLGRDRAASTPRGGPRTIDLDILLFGDRIISTPELTIPHPRMHLRRFVLVPLISIWPGVRIPTLGITAETALERLGPADAPPNPDR
jgi:2-amino-4-hydroxy-6-hydroxymethyldihydropteridine diphosphokinase